MCCTANHKWYHIEGTSNPADSLTRDKATYDDVIAFQNPEVFQAPVHGWPIRCIESEKDAREAAKQAAKTNEEEVTVFTLIKKISVATQESTLQGLIHTAKSWTSGVVTLMYILKMGSKLHRNKDNNEVMDCARKMFYKFEQDRYVGRRFPPKSMVTENRDGIVYLLQRPIAEGKGEYHKMVPILPPRTELGKLII